MGIPKFYRWISERYPCLSEKIREYQIPDFDNLYLDMNGIIHSCSHPNDDDVHLRIPEEVVFKEIFRYIDFLFKMIKPRKVFFMAIDGVAPRAKMNQQRGRRFRSAKLALDQEAEAIKKGEKLPSEDRFDSNCITPGTEFMARLHEQLQYFVKVKVSTDVLWQREGLVIYLSGHDVPGEGEHKIMDFIRHIRSQPDYNAETRHCLYGLDADLIMLGLSTHELHFSLLREEVKFGGGSRKRKRPAPVLAGGDNGTKFDVNKVSVFKPPEDQISDQTPVDGVREGAEARLLKPSITFAGALKTENVQAPLIDTVAEAKRVENGLVLSDGNRRKDTYNPPLPEKTTFLLLHLSLLRDYLDEEFAPLKDKLNNHAHIQYDLEKLIDDWILMCILVGNDFVPNLPHLHITTNALPMVYSKYMEVLPKMTGYINESGHLSLERFEMFLREISVHDVEHFRQTYDDMKYMASKTGKNIVLGDTMMEAFEFDDNDGFTEEAIEEAEEPPAGGPMSELQALINRTEESLFGSKSESENGNDKSKTSADLFPDDEEIFDEEDSQELRLEFAQSKRNYYMTKMHFKEVVQEVQQLAIEYIRAVQWVLLYYYKGVSSWCWYYPAHYAPFSSDLRNFKHLNITFDKGQPFKPFEQLLAVLPSQSKKLLPQCFQWLMTDEKSPIIEYYPEKFEQDLNGKKQDWEAVILIPFIDEKQLLRAMETEASKLSSEESFRNSRGKLLLYSYTPEDTGPVKAVGASFPSLPASHYKVEGRVDVPYDPALLPKGVHPRAVRDRVYQGFPTIKSIPHKSYLKDVQVKVFEMQARDVSMVLDLGADKLDPTPKADVEALAKNLIGKMVWVNWPHLTPALVTGVSDNNVKYNDLFKGQLVKDKKHNADEQDKVLEGLYKRHLTSKGIKLGDSDVVVWAKLMEGRKLRFDKAGQIVVDNLWQNVEQPFAYQTTITHENYVTVFAMADDEAKTFRDIYHRGDIVFLLTRDLLGAKAVVKEHDRKRAKVTVNYSIPVYRNINDEAMRDIDECLMKWNNDNYFTTMEAARKCNLDAHAFSKITGCIFVTVEKGGSPKKVKGRKRKKRDQVKAPEDDGAEAENESSSEEEVYIAQETKKVNVGLDLKFNKKNQKARGYTTKDVNNGNKNGKWNYSKKTIDLVQEYVRQFPDFVKFLSKNCSFEKNSDTYLASEIFPEDPVGKIRDMQNWIDSIGLRQSVQRIDLSSDILDDDEIQIIWKHILGCKLNAEADAHESINVSPNYLFKPGLTRGSVEPVPGQTYDIMDRIICVDPSASMPLGQKGTIVGVQEPQARDHKDTVEESFKATSATLLLTLIVLPDPQPDIFDKASENGVNNGKPSTSAKNDVVVNKDMSIALSQFLGLASSTDENVPKVEEKKRRSEGNNNNIEEYKPVPRLVKLFPYQVINITETEVQKFINEKTKDAEQKSNSVQQQRKKSQQDKNQKKIPPLLSLPAQSSLPPRPAKTVQPPFKLINFVKSNEPFQPNPPTPVSVLRKGGTLIFENKARTEERSRNQGGSTNSSRSQNAPRGREGPAPKSKERDQQQRPKREQQEKEPSRPITILKRPQTQNEGNASGGSGQLNPILGLLESSHQQQKVQRSGSKSKKPLNAAETEELEMRVHELQRKRDDNKRKPKLTEKKSPKGVEGAPFPAPAQKSKPTMMNPDELLQLLQQQIPDPHLKMSELEESNAKSQPQQRQARGHQGKPPPGPTMHHPPQPLFSSNPVLQPFPLMFPPQQALLMGIPHSQQPIVHPFAPLFSPQAPNGIRYRHSSHPIPPGAPSQTKFTHQSRQNGKSRASRPQTTSFVPTQVLAGRGGSDSFVREGKSHNVVACRGGGTASVSCVPSQEKMTPPAAPEPKKNQGGKEVSIDMLLQEASKQKREPSNNGPSKSNGEATTTTDAGKEILNKLASQLSGFEISTSPAKMDSKGDQSGPPSKSRLAANFSFGGC